MPDPLLYRRAIAVQRQASLTMEREAKVLKYFETTSQPEWNSWPGSHRRLSSGPRTEVWFLLRCIASRTYITPMIHDAN